MKRYAFIDVSNTYGVATKILNFKIDWFKVYDHLKSEKWNCDKVFYYRGNKGTRKSNKDFNKLEEYGYEIRTKKTHIHKGKTYSYNHKCSCNKEEVLEIPMLGHRKSNCDVELTVDAMELAGPDTEFLILTGDGDFSYLMRNVIEKGVKIRIISNTSRDKKGDKSFSTRLSDLILEEIQSGLKRVSFIDLNDWKIAIMKDKKKPPSSVAVSELRK